MPVSADAEKLLIPAEFYFQATVNVQYVQNLEQPLRKGNSPEGLTLLPGLSFALPDTEVEHQFSVGWNDEGIAVDVVIQGQTTLSAAGSRSGARFGQDTVSILIDTRDMKSNRRTNRFCHLFQTEPGKSGKDLLQVRQIPLAGNNSQEGPTDREEIPTAFSSQKNSCRISCWLSREVLLGYDPENVPSIGFYYYIQTARQGNAYWGVGPQFPVDSDQSLWPSLKLVR